MKAGHPTDPAEQYALLAARSLGKTYGSKTVLQGASLHIAKGQRVCIVGPNGSGKTTLLRCLNLLVAPSVGELYFEGKLVGRWPGEGPQLDVRRLRTRIAMVFQHFELFPHLTAIGNITLGPRHVLHQTKAAADANALQLLRQIGLEEFAKAHPLTLSGGQRQRIAIARALAMNPEVILFDEPTSALDSEMVGEVLELMARLASDGMTMVIVTHELQFAREVADWIVVMDSGMILEQGPTDEILTSPRNARTRAILRLSRQTTSGATDTSGRLPI